MSAPTSGGARGPAHSSPAPAKAESKPEPEVKAKDSGALERAQEKAPNLTAAFVAKYEIDDDELAAIADGLTPPPPFVKDGSDSELHRTDGGWMSTHKGMTGDEPVKSFDPRFPDVDV